MAGPSREPSRNAKMDSGKSKAKPMKPIYIATFHQSRFGKLMGMPVPQILDAAIQGACRQVGVPASALDVASVGPACSCPHTVQVLRGGLVALARGVEGKHIEAVENAGA